MASEEKAAAFSELTQFYGKSISTDGMAIWWKKLRSIHHFDLWAAVEAITHHERTFPTPAIVLKYAKDAEAKRLAKETIQREQEAEQQKQQRDRDDQRLFKPGLNDSKIHKDAARIMEQIFKFNNRIKLAKDPAEIEIEKGWYLVKAYREMHAKYPYGNFDKSEQEQRRELDRLIALQPQSERKAS